MTFLWFLTSGAVGLMVPFFWRVLPLKSSKLKGLKLTYSSAGLQFRYAVSYRVV